MSKLSDWKRDVLPGLLKAAGEKVHFEAMKACTAESNAARERGDKSDMYAANRCWRRVHELKIEEILAPLVSQ